MREHVLKTWPEFFEEVFQERKNFEIRSATDRAFSVGDVVRLCEWEQHSEEFTGREVLRQITYKTAFPDGLQPGYVALGLMVPDARLVVDIYPKCDHAWISMGASTIVEPPVWHDVCFKCRQIRDCQQGSETKYTLRWVHGPWDWDDQERKVARHADARSH